jgi:hypothetical protein
VADTIISRTKKHFLGPKEIVIICRKPEGKCQRHRYRKTDEILGWRRRKGKVGGGGGGEGEMPKDGVTRYILILPSSH